jgi:uncharacterized membrane protein YeaQ/YmgE (transglycosylase-associated protein family)
MADPATSAAVGGFAAGAALASLANHLGVPVPTLVVAVIGATVAVSVSDRIKWSPAGIWAGVVSFALALSFGIAGGKFAAPILVQALAKAGFDVTLDAALGVCALILSIIGQSVLLPAISKRFGVEIDARGVAK